MKKIGKLILSAVALAGALGAGVVCAASPVGDLLSRWQDKTGGMTGERFEGLPRQEQEKIRELLAALESRRATQVRKLKAAEPRAWNAPEYLTRQERLTERGLARIGETEPREEEASVARDAAGGLGKTLDEVRDAVAAVSLANTKGGPVFFDNNGRLAAPVEGAAPRLVSGAAGATPGAAVTAGPAAGSVASPSSGEPPAVQAASEGGAQARPAGTGEAEEAAGSRDEDESSMQQQPAAPSVRQGKKPAGKPIAGSKWVELEMEGGVSESDPASVEHLRFWDNAFTEACKQAQIPIKQKIKGGDFFAATVQLHRSLRRLPIPMEGNRLHIIDRGRIRLQLKDSEKLVDLGNNAIISLGFGIELDGESVVVRPLKDQKPCRQIDRIIDLSDIKSALPLESSRFSNMKVGEIWMVPVKLRVHANVGPHYGRPGVSVALVFGYSREGGTSVTLKRLSPEELRFRLRIDQASVFGIHGKVTSKIKGTEWGDDVKDELEDTFGGLVGEKLLFRQLNKYLQAKLAIFTNWSKGEEAQVEFILNPNDKKQMEALEDFLTGDIDVLDTLAKETKAAAKALIGKGTSAKDVRKLAGKASDKLGEDPSFVGRNEFRRSRSGVHVQIPFLWRGRYDSGRERDKIVVLDEEGGQFRVYSADKEGKTELFRVPFAGSLAEYKSRRSVIAFGYRDGEGQQQPPVALYVQQAAFKNYGENAADELIDQANEIAQYIGARGQGANPDTVLPVNVRFYNPPPGETAAPQMVKKGFSAFTMVFNDKAVADMKKAAPMEVYKAYANTINPNNDYSQEVDWVLKNGKLRKDGTIDYDQSELRNAFFSMRKDEDLKVVQAKLDEAAAIVHDLREVGIHQDGRHKGRPRSSGGQAEDTRNLLSGDSRNGLSYESVMKVLVQLVDPADLSAEFFVEVDRGNKGPKDLSARFGLNPDMNQAESVRRMNEALQRFRKPSKYSD